MSYFLQSPEPALEMLEDDRVADLTRIAEERHDQRRYEIAKAVLAGFASSDHMDYSNPGFAPEWAVRWADALLAELEK